MSDETVLLAGATGVFGRHIARVLTGAGYHVRGLGRSPANDIRADINDAPALRSALAGHRADIVIHAATALAKPPIRHRDMTATDTLRTTGMRNLVDGASQVGASRFISESMMFGYGYSDHGRAPLTEAAEFGPTQRDPHLEEHVAAMRTKEALTRDVNGISLRYGLFYGPGGTESVVGMLRKRMLPALGSGDRTLSWVHLEDAADAMLAAIRYGRPGAAYNIADDAPMSFVDQIKATADTFGTPKPLPTPAWMLRPAGLLYAMLHTDLRLDTTAARTDLHWHPTYPTVADGLKAMVAV